MSQQRFIIIDGNALVHRAFHAIPPMTNKNGQVLNAVYGFTSILLKAIKDLKPDYLAVTFDLAAPTFRHKEYKEYKAKRVKPPQELYDQMPLIKDLLRAMKIKIYEREGFEADDVIATLAAICHSRESGNPAVETVILTGDLDTLQLVDENTKIYSLRKGISDIFIYDEAAVKERYGLLPNQMTDYKALRGDPSDNILGVRGIGEKTAADLIQKFGSIEGVYEKIKRLKDYKISDLIIKKLEAGKEAAFQSKHLVELVRDVPIDFKLEDCKMADYNNPAARDLLAGWEFGSLIKRLDGGMGEMKDLKIGRLKDYKIVEVKNKEGEEKLKRESSKAKKIAIYLSDDGQASGLKAKLFGLVLTFDGQKVYYLSVALTNLLIFKSSNLQIVGHDLKRTLEILKRHGWDIDGELSDVMLMDYLLDPGSRSHDLPSLVLRYLGAPLKESPQTGLFGENPQDLAQKLLSLWAVEAKLRLELEEKGFISLYKKIDEPLVEPLMQMEGSGIKIDEKYLSVLAKKLSKKEEELRKNIFEMAGQEFNIASPQQLKEILFEKLKISTEGIRKGKTGLSTAASELEKMRGEHPVIELVFDYREIA
ncbi:MAG: DNA polymerase, partial [Patescibacteria group bacterium]